MAIMKWTVFGLCTIWAMGGAIVMLGYGTSSSPAELALSALMNFGPFMLSLLWVVWPRRRTKR